MPHQHEAEQDEEEGRHELGDFKDPGEEHPGGHRRGEGLGAGLPLGDERASLRAAHQRRVGAPPQDVHLRLEQREVRGTQLLRPAVRASHLTEIPS